MVKVHNYITLIFKLIAKKTTGQWTHISVQSDQRVNAIIQEQMCKFNSSFTSNYIETEIGIDKDLVHIVDLVILLSYLFI